MPKPTNTNARSRAHVEYVLARDYEPMKCVVIKQKIGAFMATIADGWCDAHESLMRAYALRVLAEHGDRYKLAKTHLAECPVCRRFVNECCRKYGFEHRAFTSTPRSPVITVATAFPV
jgi:hypothetical protein